MESTSRTEARSELRRRSKFRWTGKERKGPAPDKASADLYPLVLTQLALQESNLALRRLDEIREQEAKRIAHALHDEASQILAAVHLAIEAVARELSPEQRSRLSACRCALDLAELELRRISHELRPSVLDDFGLTAALEFLASGVAKRTGLRVEVTGGTGGRLPAAIETALYRVAKEALANAVRHARATRVVISVTREADAVTCRVCDDGVGFDVAEYQGRRGERGFGLVAMRERLAAQNGALEVRSTIGCGAEFIARVPVKQAMAAGR